MKKYLWLIIPLFIIILLAITLWPQKTNAPKFHAIDLTGQTITEQQFQNKITLLNFWYPSCPGCVSEMPKLIALSQQYQNNPHFQIIGIALPYDPETSVRNYVTTRKIPFTIVYDKTGNIGQQYNVQVAPTSFLLNAQGQILKTFLGEPDFTALSHQIDQQIKTINP